MAKKPESDDFDTVIIGGGPSSFILSYILHGHIPHYTGRHHDPILHRKLSQLPSLLHITPSLSEHFSSSLRYSTQALPINTLLDTLIRPNADTEVNPTSHVRWQEEPGRAVRHVILTDGDKLGGQWGANPVDASWDIGTLSYSEMLSLPGYSYAQHYEIVNGTKAPDFERPSRTRVADYFAAYPRAVGIQSSIRTRTRVSLVSRSRHGFSIILKDGLHLGCRHLVLATGIFTHSIPPPPLLSPLTALNDSSKPVLVIGSGFSAADVIISAPSHRKIMHIYHWDPEKRPSPLRGCHHQAYPEYAGVYRQMKLAAASKAKYTTAQSPVMRRKGNPFFRQLGWACVYEGFPNAAVIDVRRVGEQVSVVVRLESGEEVWREVGGLAYVVGRRGSLAYLDSGLRDEVFGTAASVTNGSTIAEITRAPEEFISGRTLRAKAEISTEVAPDVFIIGSLTGDSLVRHAYGSCVFAASRILGALDEGVSRRATVGNDTSLENVLVNGTAQPPSPSQHQDLHVDRREVIALVNELEGGG